MHWRPGKATKAEVPEYLKLGGGMCCHVVVDESILEDANDLSELRDDSIAIF